MKNAALQIGWKQHRHIILYVICQIVLNLFEMDQVACYWPKVPCLQLPIYINLWQMNRVALLLVRGGSRQKNHWCPFHIYDCIFSWIYFFTKSWCSSFLNNWTELLQSWTGRKEWILPLVQLRVLRNFISKSIYQSSTGTSNQTTFYKQGLWAKGFWFWVC